MGYLGKISAVVSASTADFDAKLSKSAKEVGAFASRVQSNLTSASRSAAKALEGIYTPMQRFERSLQAAGSLKLSFKGFPGMIRDLDSLQARLNSTLSARQVAIVLRTTGLDSVEKVRQSINGLKSKDVEIIARFGGLEKLKELQKKVVADVDIDAAVKKVSEMEAAFAAAKSKVSELNAVPVGPKVSKDGLNALKRELQEATDAAGRLMGREYTGKSSLEQSIDGVSQKLLTAQQNLLKATAVRDSLLEGASGKNANKADLENAQAKVDQFTAENAALAGQLKSLEGYRDQIKKIRAEIRKAEAVTSSPSATGEDRAKAFKDMEAAQRAAAKAAKDLQRQLAARYGLNVSVADLNELITRGDKAGVMLQRLKPLIDALGKSDFNFAADRMRKMQSVAEQITKPLQAAVSRLASLGPGIEAAFGPALKNTQKNVETLANAVDSQTRPSAALDKYFADVQAQVERTIASIERLNEVSLLSAQAKTGKEFVFEQPVLKEAIDKSASIGNQAAALPAEVLKANPQVAESLVDLRKKTDDAVAAYASLLAVMDRKSSSPKEQQAAKAALEGFISRLVEAQGIAEKEVQLRVNVAAAERSVADLRAKLAGSTKLSIGGTQGIVSDLDDLRKRLDATLTRRQVDVILKATGLPTIDEVRRRLAGLHTKDVEVILKATGQRTLDDVKSRIDGLKTKELDVILRATGLPGIDEARRRLETLKPKDIAVLLRATNLSSLDEVKQRLDGLKQKDVEVILKAAGFSAVDEARKRLDGLKPKEVEALLKVTGFGTIEELRSRLGSLKPKEVDIILQATGFPVIDEVRKRLGSLKQKQIDIILNATGYATLDEVRRRLDGLNTKQLDAVLRVVGLPAIDEAKRRLDGLKPKEVVAILKATGLSNLDEVKRRIDFLKPKEVALILKATGLTSIDELRKRIDGLRSKDIEIITRFGGLDKLKELQRKVSVDADVRSALTNLKTLTDAFDAAKQHAAQVKAAQIDVTVNSSPLDELRQKLAATTADAGKLLGGQPVGANALEQAISQISEELRQTQTELAKTASQRDALLRSAEAGAVTPPEPTAQNNRASELTQKQSNLSQKLAALQSYLDEVKRITAEIAKAEAASSARPAASDEVTKAYRAKEQAGRAAAKAAKELQQQLSARFGLTISVDDLNRLIERADKAGSIVQRLKPLMDALGKSDFGATADKARGLQTVIEQMTKPIEAATDRLAAMGPEFLAAFLPALLAATDRVDALNTAIIEQKAPSEALDRYYATVKSQVDLTIESIERLNRVSLLASQAKTGKEFVFEQPVLKEALDKTASIGNQAAELPAAAIKANPKVAESLVELRQRSIEAAAAYGGLLAAIDSNVSPNGQRAAREELERVIARLREAQVISEREIKLILDAAEANKKADALKVKLNELREGVAFTVTGKVQNLDQARSELQRLQGELGKLDATQRAPIARKIIKLGKLVEAGGIQSLEQVQGLIDRINKAVARKLRINLDAKEAREQAKQLEATLAKFRQDVAFTVTGKVQNVEQARAELARIQADLDKLTESQRIAIAPKVIRLGEIVSAKDIENLDEVNELLADAKSLSADAIKTNVSTAEADAKLKATKGRLDALRTEVRFVVTGSFSNADQVEAELKRVAGDIAKLKDEQRAAFGQRLEAVVDLLGEEKFQEAAIAAKNLRSDVEQQMEVKITSDEAQKKLDSLAARASKFRDENAFVVTGRPQNLEQAETRESSLKSEISSLDRVQRQNFRGLLDDAAVAKEKGDLEQYIDLLEIIAARLRDEKRLRVTTQKAQDELDRLNAKVDALKDNASFVITGKVQNASQTEAEIGKIIASLDKLNEAQRAGLQPKIDAAVASLGARDAKGNPDVVAMRAAIDDLRAAYDRELEIKVTTDAAKKKVDDLKASLASIADKIGDPSKPIDRLRTAVEKANAAVAKLPAGALRASLASQLFQQQDMLREASAPAATPMSDTDINAAAAQAAAIATSAEAGMPLKKNDLGAAFGSVERNVAGAQAKVMSLQGELQKLPVPLQAAFIPAINKVRESFQKLTLSSSAAEIDAFAKKAAGLERALSRAQQAAKLGGSLGEALNTAAFTRAEKQLGFIRSKLLEVGAAASGPVATAFDTFSAFISNAARSGTLGLASTKEQADQLAEKIGEAALAAGLFKNKADAMSFVKNIGDVGRAGVDKYSLALNQAAFAVDDFLSSTGGIEFKLRAVSNNITQLAFILGGTYGLFVGLGAVIGGQIAVGLVKWYNNGRTAEDQTKALNEALARQKSLVEDLASAFRSLGDAMTQGTLSQAGQRFSDTDRQIDGIRKKQQEAARARAADIDPDVQRERATQAVLGRQLEGETSIGRRIAIQDRIARSKELEDAAAAAAAGRTAGVADARRAVERSVANVGVASLPNAADPTAQAARVAAAERVREKAAEEARQRAGDTAEDARRALLSEISRLSPLAKGGNALGSDAASVAAREIENLKRVLVALDSVIGEAATDLKAINIAEAAQQPAERIRQAQEEIAKAIELGIPNARLFASELDSNARALKRAYDKLEEAQKETGDERAKLVDDAAAEVERVRGRQEELTTQSDAFRYERTVDPQRQFEASAERASRNLGAAGLGEGRLARQMRELEFRRETIRQQAALPEFQNPMAQRLLQQSEQALTAEINAIEAATIAIKIFAAELDRASEEVKGNLNTAQQAADDARRADLANSTPQTQEARRMAEADLERQREFEQAAQTKIAAQRDKLEKKDASPEEERLRDIEKELAGGSSSMERDLQQATRQREEVVADIAVKNAQAQEQVDSAERKKAPIEMAQARMVAVWAEKDARGKELGLGDDAEYDDIERLDPAFVKENLDKSMEAIKQFEDLGDFAGLNAARKELEAALRNQAEVVSAGAERLAEIDDRLANLPRGDNREELIRERDAIRAKMEEDARQSQATVDAARDASTRDAEQAKQATRGRERSKTPEQKFQEETDAGLEEIRQYFGRKAEDEGGLVDFAGQKAAEERFMEERAKEARTATKAGRGREAMMTERQRLGRDLNEGLVKDVQAASDEMAAKANAETEARRGAYEKAGGLVAVNQLDLEEFTKYLKERLEDPDRTPEDVKAAAEDVRKAQAALKEARKEEDVARDAMNKPKADAQAEFKAAQDRIIQEQMEKVAPMMEQFRQERETALLQGPSRAALQVNDVATTAGQSELNRLLRGDDAAKDVNLSELQKQSGLLQEVVRAINGIVFNVAD